MELAGLYQSVLISADAARSSAFYATTLGLTQLASGFSDQLLFTDEPEQSGAYIRLIVAPDAARGRNGPGAIHHTAFLVESTNAQLKWKRWLEDHSVNVLGPYDRGYFRSIYFRDPDRALLEIATRWPGLDDDEDEEELGTHDFVPAPEFLPVGRDEAAIKQQTWPEPLKKIGGDMDLRGLHHISAVCRDIERTAAFYTGPLGLRLVKRTRSFDDSNVPHWYFGSADAQPGTLITFFQFPPNQQRPAQPGLSVPLSFGFAVDTPNDLEQWRARLSAAGVEIIASPFATANDTLFFHDPDGILVSVSVRA